MKLISSLLKKFKKSSYPKPDPFKCTKNIWNHNEPICTQENCQGQEIKKQEDPVELLTNHKTLRRQNCFIGFQQKRQYISEEVSQTSQKMKNKARCLQTQKRINEHYRRIQLQPKIQI